MVFPTINDTKVTTADTYGGDVMTKIMLIFGGYDISSADPTNIVSIGTEFNFWWGKLGLWDASHTYVMHFVTPTITGDLQLGFPNDLDPTIKNEIVFRDSQQTLFDKTISTAFNNIVGIRDANIASDANVAWSKVSKTGADIGDFSSVDLTGKTNGVFLKWSSSANKWICDIPAGGGDVVAGANVGTGIGIYKNKTTGTLNLKTLVQATGNRVAVATSGTDAISFDVTEANLSIANMGGNLTWARLTLTGSHLTDIADVDTSGITDNQALKWNASTQTWVPYTPAGGGGATALTGLSDVAIATPANNQFFRYNSTTSKWNNQTVSVGDVFLATANVFTAAQKINKDLPEVLTLYRPLNTVNSLLGIKYDFNNAAGTPAEVTYGEELVSVEANTSGAHRGDYHIQLAIAGALADRFKVFTGGTAGGIVFGKDMRVSMDQGALSALRNFTFPDFDTMFAGLAGAQTFTGLKSFDEELRFKESTAANVSNPAAGYQALYLDSTSHQLSRKDSAGAVTSLEAISGNDLLPDGTPIPTTGRWGAFFGGTTTGRGIFNITNTVTGTTTYSIISTTETTTNISTAATDDTIAEIKTSEIFSRQSNMVFRAKWALNQTTNTVVMIGCSGLSVLPVGGGHDTPLNNSNGVMITTSQDVESVYQVSRNDGGTTQTKVPTTIANNTTAAHTVEMQINDTQVVVILDGVTYGPYTIEIPTLTTPMSFYIHIEAIGGTSKMIKVYRSQITML